ncbi:MAG: hypothetical protein C5S40_00070 [ANME-2 cluster archaeon]|nr:hypothetical protein [ANME-2 cluster archaeon]
MVLALIVQRKCALFIKAGCEAEFGYPQFHCPAIKGLEETGRKFILHFTGRDIAEYIRTRVITLFSPIIQYDIGT